MTSCIHSLSTRRHRDNLQGTFPFSLDERVEIHFIPLTLDAAGFNFEEIDVAPFEEKTLREPPRRFDLGWLDLKADAFLIELAGPGFYCLHWL